MINYISFEEFGKERVQSIINLWNDDFGFMYPITPELLLRNTYETPGFKAEHSFIALNDNEIVGFVINKIWQNDFVISKYENVGWISLIYVSKKTRRLGIGSELLNKSINSFKSLGIKKVQLGSDYQNFFPGLPKDFKENLDWFLKRGFNTPGETNDLIHYVKPYDEYKSKQYKDNVNYQIGFAEKEDVPELIKFMKETFDGRWLKELLDYLDNDYLGKEFVIAKNEQNHVCGFVRVGEKNTPTSKIGFSLTYRARFKNLGGIGPLGVSKDCRGNNIAYNLLVFAINYLKCMNCSEIIIDWTNLMSFYRQFKFEIWKSYYYLQMEI